MRVTTTACGYCLTLLLALSSLIDIDNLETQVYTIFSRTRPVSLPFKEPTHRKGGNSREAIRNPGLGSNSDADHDPDHHHSDPPASTHEWPGGAFGLPATKNSCPDTPGLTWERGYLFRNTAVGKISEFLANNSNTSTQVSVRGIGQHFCIKPSRKNEVEWPKGTYCVYQATLTCPAGLHSGFMYWSDENQDGANYLNGTLPLGNYGSDNVIRYCCRNDGDKNKPISLPPTAPFYLLPFESPVCQKVEFMSSTLELVRYQDTSKRKSRHGGVVPFGLRPSDGHHDIYLCYYHPAGGDGRLGHLGKRPVVTYSSDKSPEERDRAVNYEVRRIYDSLSRPFSNGWVSVFASVAFAVVVIGMAVFLLVRQVVFVGVKKARASRPCSSEKGGKLSGISQIRRQVSKKFSKTGDICVTPKKSARLTEQQQQQQQTRASIGSDDEEELAEDHLVPKNSELHQSLAMILMNSSGPVRK